MEHKFEKRLNGIIEKYGCQAPELADGTLINSIVLDVFRRRCSGKKSCNLGGRQKECGQRPLCGDYKPLYPKSYGVNMLN